MTRPAVDVVVPFRGDHAELASLTARLDRLRLAEGDTLLVVDNTPGHPRPGTLHAAEVATPAYARNRGAAEGGAEWLVFLDADVTPATDLIDRYFAPAPADHTALLAGGIADEPVPPDGPPAARYAYIREFMSQRDTLFRSPEWGFPKTANAAVRRTAFEDVGGFRDELRAAEDADLTFRLRAAGWAVEQREHAVVTHRSRQTVPEFVRQKLTHGAGGAWLEREWPGASPRRRLPGLVWWGVRTASAGLAGAARARDRDRALCSVLEPVELITHEVGRWFPNERRSAGAASRGRSRG